MTVKELIDKLIEYDPDLRVTIDDIELGFRDIDLVTEGWTSRVRGNEHVIVLD